MSKHAGLFGGLSLSVAVLLAAQEDFRREIQAVYDRASHAAVSARTREDIDSIHGWLDTADCVYTDAGQPTRSWAEQRVYAAADLRTPLESLSIQIQEVEVRGSSAIVTTLVKGVARLTDNGGRFGAKGAAHDVETTATVRDVWVKAPDGWRRKSHTKIVANKITAVDGKSIPP